MESGIFFFLSFYRRIFTKIREFEWLILLKIILIFFFILTNLSLIVISYNLSRINNVQPRKSKENQLV